MWRTTPSDKNHHDKVEERMAGSSCNPRVDAGHSYRPRRETLDPPYRIIEFLILAPFVFFALLAISMTRSKGAAAEQRFYHSLSQSARGVRRGSEFARKPYRESEFARKPYRQSEFARKAYRESEFTAERLSTDYSCAVTVANGRPMRRLVSRTFKRPRKSTLRNARHRSGPITHNHDLLFTGVALFQYATCKRIPSPKAGGVCHGTTR
ncbi:hypothetical protein K432DRAFT_456447 [Lepidopterella palustris CBS 459.81]|uniref:Uncharacterized protein n=1 Tax=Lepidopterella palustris CBS 459.81 TaxID=1314670 RepID=A0A8E2JE21_9PEZI|nr:hypothetical protein K432DRAFT_456447 [Lepidopterella palustris CBS 459.81]